MYTDKIFSHLVKWHTYQQTLWALASGTCCNEFDKLICDMLPLIGLISKFTCRLPSEDWASFWPLPQTKVAYTAIKFSVIKESNARRCCAMEMHKCSYNRSHLRAIKLKGWLENSSEYWMWHVHGTLMLAARGQRNITPSFWMVMSYRCLPRSTHKGTSGIPSTNQGK